MLLHRAGRGEEELIAAGAVAGATCRIFGNLLCALALGRWRSAHHRPRRRWSLPITARLRLAALLAVGAGAITAGGAPTPPAAGRLLTGGAAITGLRPGRPKPTLTALEQTAATAEGLSGRWVQEGLTRAAGVGKVKGAHGG